MKQGIGIIIGLVLFGVLHIQVTDGATTVSHISPKYGSLNGGTRITIHGTGFAKTQFNYGAGNSHLGNYVELVYGTHPYVCDIHTDGCTNVTITCNTRPMPEGVYTVKVKVDNVPVDSSNYCSSDATKCQFVTRYYNTPTISSIEPRSGPPGTLVTVCGRIVTTRFGSNIQKSDNGLSNKLLRVSHTGQSCALKDGDDFYGMWLDNPDTLNLKGCFKCKMSGRYVGNQNFSFIVENEFGRSKPDIAVLKLNSNKKIGMFQTYAVIKSVSPAAGSVAGGTVLTISGENFDQTDAPATVSIGGEECKVLNVTDTEITCVTPAQPASQTTYTGNRGWLREEWYQTPGTFANRANILSLSTSASDYNSSIIDSGSFSEDKYANSVNRLTGWFVPSITGKYMFQIKADDFAALSFSATGPPSGLAEIATCPSYSANYWKSGSQTSQQFDLVAGTPYYMQVVHGNFLNASGVHVKAITYTSPVTSSMSVTGVDEIQYINISSTVSPEVQVLSFSGMDAASTTYTAEVQTLTVSDITGPNVDASYRLELDGVYTAPIAATSDATAVAKALNNLASLAPDTVSVAQTSPSATSEEFTITFNSTRGNLKLMTTKVLPDTSTLSVVVSAKTDGVAGRNKAYLELDGVVSPAIPAGATADQVKAALNTMFGVRCPPQVTQPEDGASGHVEDFEGVVKGIRGGEVTSEVECLCGRKCLKNPERIYDASKISAKTLGPRVDQYRTLCFGYQGNIKQIRVKYDYKGATDRFNQYINADIEASLKSWNYTCIDIGTPIYNKNNDKTFIRAWEIEVIWEETTGDQDNYIDAVSLLMPDKASSDIGLGFNELRLKAAKPGGYPMKDISVTGTGPYTVTMSPYECSNPIDLLKVASSQTTVSVSSSRTAAANPPVTGTFDVVFGSKSVTIPIERTTTAEAVQVLLQSTFRDTMGEVSVEFEGDCANHAYIVTMITNRGDQPEMTVQNINLKGNSATASINTKRNGAAMFDPIPGDLLRTPASLPQVSAVINGIPSACDGSCTYEWNTASTPTITGSSPAQGTQALNTVLTIDSTGFSATQSENSVMIGGVACDVTGSTTNRITCNVANGPMGSFPIVVKVGGKGQATGSFQFEYTAGVNSLSPASGSLGGGTTVVISGYGFDPKAAATVGGVAATVVSSQPGQLTILTPKAAAAGAVDVVVLQHSTNFPVSSQFTYDQAQTPTISALSITEASVFGGETLTITGTDFGASATSADALKINGKTATITSYSATQVVATVPANQPGVYSVDLAVGTKGYANAASGGSISYIFKVTQVSPVRGSLYGGTMVTIDGQGFGTDASKIQSAFGTFPCAIKTISNTKITCMTGSTAQTHKVTNQGSHLTHGKGFLWEPQTLNAEVGDIIQWQWTSPVSGYTFGVFKSPNITAKVTEANSFSSGTQSESGSFNLRVSSTGTHTYWSGFVDPVSKLISLHGSITVGSKGDQIQNLVLKAGDIEAEYDVTNKGSVSPTACEQEITSCSTLTGDATKFNFAYQGCMTPSWSSVSHNQAAATQTIDLMGAGFATGSCQNEVTLGSYACAASSSTANKITCTVDTQNTMKVASYEVFDVVVGNRGRPLIEMETQDKRAFSLIPHISAISPASGSTNGGTALTISGGGFVSDATSVMIESINCPVTSVDYSKVVCTLPSGRDGFKSVRVTVTSNGQTGDAHCSLTACAFQYDAAATPTVTGVTPDTVSGSTTLTISGTKFGTVSSAVTVSVGGEDCTITSLTDTSIVCTVASAPVGDQRVDVILASVGKAASTVTVTSADTLTSVTPSSGSTEGGTQVVIAGNGFVFNKTSVNIDGNPCEVDVSASTLTSVTCVTPSGTAGGKTVTVVSNGVTFTSTLTFTFDAAATPAVTSVSPTSGNQGSQLTINGNLFSGTTANNVVMVGTVPCAVSAATPTSITCTVGAQAPGQYNVNVNVDGVGRATSSSTFSYTVTAASVSPASGSLGGGQTVTVAGTGFSPSTTTVSICGQACAVDTAASSATQLVCSTPASTGTTTVQCDVVVSDNGQSSTLTSAYEYNAAASPTVNSVTPSIGSTSGGTTLTISGSGFGTTQSAVTVSIGGIPCVVQSVSNTQVVCVTGARPSGSVDTQIGLQVNGGGNARQIGAAFSYIYAWSDTNTWGGNPAPGAGEIVVIPIGMTMLLDTTTPVIKMLLIQGGKVIFDEQDITLNAEYILITDGGALQVGTESQPFQSKAVVQLHGNYRGAQLPVYGSKVLAVRNGTLDLHGKPNVLTWTLLGSTANAGATTITLQQGVDWEVGSEIVIATTGHRHSQGETEKREITAISADGKTLTLDRALTYKHLGETETYGSTNLELRAEVGLLTHNVKVRGYTDNQWADKIEACPDGFDTGEFVTQTCFQGRFGDEVGSDEFGSQILIHAPRPNEHIATARISYVEVTHAGQAFRLGRYPIHFHLNGDMSDSYVRGCGIHKTFNRAVNVHGTHNTLVEKTVIYNIMGGAFFLEDGVETGNTFQFNLALFVKASTSLLNDDITPASFWVTNPNNTIQNNHAAGGTHFGFWYRMHEHPDGPSFDPNICPQRVPLGIFRNNTAHSFGWFALWVFQTWQPREDGSCASTAALKTSVMETLTAWNCEKGAEIVDGGAIQSVGFILANNEKAGMEGKLVLETAQYDEALSHAYKDMVIIGRSPLAGRAPKWSSSSTGCTIGGIVLPYGTNGMIISGIFFYNFNADGCSTFTFTKIDGTCSDFCGGLVYKTKALTFDTESAKRKTKFEFLNHAAIEDLDGTLTGQAAGSTVIPTIPILPTGSCSSITNGLDVLLPVSVCQPSVRFVRMSFNNPVPDDLKGKDALYTNQYGTGRSYYRFKRITHPFGWVVLLVAGEKYDMVFENADQLTNISYSATFYGFHNNDDHVIICQDLDERPDRFYKDGANGIAMSPTPLSINDNKNGDWFFDNTTNKMCYMVSGKLNKKRSTAAIPIDATTDRKLNVNAFKCYFDNCTAPPDPDTIPPVCVAPGHHLQSTWSAAEWTLDAEGYVTNVAAGQGTRGAPVTGEKVKIAKDSWVKADTAIPVLDSLLLLGTLEMDHGPSQDRTFTIDATYVYILGGKLMAGCAGQTTFNGKLDIILRGDHSTPVWPRTQGPNIGSKVIASFGGLDLHGTDVPLTWTKLSQTAAAGSNVLVLSEDVNWAAGSQILIAPTSYDVLETETMTIQSVAADKRTITLTSNLAYKHIAASETFANGKGYSIGAEVGLLSRNIRIIGGEYANQDTEAYGARVLVGVTADATRTYTGYARLSNVEFVRSGQEGYTATFDPRYGVSFMDIGELGNIKPCYVKKCAFHHGYSTAIGVFGVHGLEIQDNVIHRTVGPSIHTVSKSTRLRRNFMALSFWRGTYNGRYEVNNFDYYGTIESIGARELVMQGNAVTGSERGLYHGPAEDCTSTAEPWMDNTLHTGMMGTLVMPVDKDNPLYNQADRCLQLANFTIWKCYDYGFYHNTPFDIEVRRNTLLENGVGIFLFVWGPSALDHQFRDHYMKVEDTLIVGQTSEFDCTTDNYDISNNDNYKLAVKARSWRIGATGKVGLATPLFNQGPNMASIKPFANGMSYPAIGGSMSVKDVTFANFQSTCGSDTAVTTNPINDDFTHTMDFQGTTFYNVADNNKFFIHRPLVGVINPSDCVDMDCDGQKKILLKDVDGTFSGTGSPTSIISESEYAWDLDPRRGTGDYRIPKNMLTSPDGNRMDVSVVAKYKGIIRDSSCTKNSVWQAWVCTTYNYEHVIIENMDADTEKRRLSPVAVLGWDDDDNGYMDLINGPQDHGWCAGYTCQLRLSTFQAVMATGRNYSVYFTSTSPQHLRYRMINSDSSRAVGIATYYNSPYRLDVYCNDNYVMPKNGYKDSNDKVLLRQSTTWDEYIPKVSDKVCGENYLDNDWRHLHIVLTGSDVVDIKMTQAVSLGFGVPTMTVDQFFGENLVKNLALFLNVDASKIRIMNIKTGVDRRRRRKRSTGPNTLYTVEIANQPCSSINCTGSTTNTLTYSDHQQIAVMIINSYQQGNLSDILNITIDGLTVTEAMPPVTDPAWAQVVNAGDNYASVLKVPHRLEIREHADAGHEGGAFATQPKLNMKDVMGNMITILGASSAPWAVSVSIKAGTGTNAQAQLIGTTNVTFVDGWANFTDIGITHEGSGYVLEFTLSYPTDVVFTIDSNPLTVTQRPLKGGIVSKTNDVQQNSLVTIVLDIKDSNSNTRVTDLGWKGHMWTVTASMSTPSNFGYSGVMAGTTSGSFDSSTGQVTLNDLRFDQPGMTAIKYTIQSNPPGYSFEVEDFVEVIPPEYSTVTEDTTKEMSVKVLKDFATYGKPDVGAAVINHLTSGKSYVRAKNPKLSEGSVVVTVTITGNTTTVQQLVDDTCDSIQTGSTFTYNGQTFTLAPYMTINNQTYYGVSCGDKNDSDQDEDETKLALIITVAICCVIIVALVCGILYWKCVVQPKTKTHKFNQFDTEYDEGLKDPRYLGQSNNPEDILWRENTFQSLREKSWIPDTFRPPIQTTITEKKQGTLTGHF